MWKYVWSGLKFSSWKIWEIYFGGASGSTPRSEHGKLNSLEVPLWLLMYMLWHPWKKKRFLTLSPKLEASKADALNWFAVELLRAWAAPPCEAGALSVGQLMILWDSPNWCWNEVGTAGDVYISPAERLPFPSASFALSCSPKQC